MQYQQSIAAQNLSWVEAFRVWLKIGLLSFGGPAAQIALIHREVVEERQWLDEGPFLNALNFCMLLPGPEAMQLVTYIGWRIQGVAGGLMAGLLFVLPGAVVMLALAAVFVMFGDVPLIAGVFQGVQAAVVVIVVAALVRLANKALKTSRHWALALGAFVAIFFLELAYPVIIITAALIGAWCLQPCASTMSEKLVRPALLGQTLRAIGLGLFIWWLPIALLALVGGVGILTELGVFFSKLAVVTFGGAYSVLAYMTQDVVAVQGWLTTHEMMSGLGLAETTPGPLILVTEFVGFLSAYREGGWALGLMGALVTLWVTFVPCFLWIFAGGPYLEWISSIRHLQGALSAITAAVVGVILSLSLWFALHVFFADVDKLSVGIVSLWWPSLASVNALVVLLVVLCGYLLWVRQWSVVAVLALASGVAGLSLL